MDILYIVVPAYNEAANIENLINDWYPIVEKHNGDGLSRLVIVNDGSKDNTLELARQAAATRDKLVVLDKENGGHGDTVLFGYEYAIENKADYIFQTDSDGQTLPEEFERFWVRRRDYNGIIGKRLVREDGFSRKIVEVVLCMVLWVVFGVKVPDANAPFRLMKREALAGYIKLLPKHYNLPNAVITALYVYFGDRVAFMPITFRPRQGGKNSINIRRIFAIGIHAVRDFILIRRRVEKTGRRK